VLEKVLSLHWKKFNNYWPTIPGRPLCRLKLTPNKLFCSINQRKLDIYQLAWRLLMLDTRVVRQ